MREAGDFLRTRPIENTLLLTAVDGLRTLGPLAYGEGAAQGGWWRTADGALGGAFLHTPPYPALLSYATGDPASLAQRLAAARRPLSGINADHQAATDKWSG